MTTAQRIHNCPPGLHFELGLWNNGYCWVAGIDEAGRGALAGPVTAAAVVLPSHPATSESLSGVRDSKQMTPAQRHVWAEKIRQCAAAFGVGFASPGEIDALGILPATRLAAQRAVNTLGIVPDHLLLDYLFLPVLDVGQTSIVKGDQRSLSIAAASVIAKTARDAYMEEQEMLFPGYGLGIHKGYGTAIHLAALEYLGPSPIHRRSFGPVRKSDSGSIKSWIAS